jgi:two-component system chemotaxis response regulator CheY
MEQKDYKFLVVDDHLMLRQMVSITLKRSGFENIDTANDGALALSKIQEAANQSAPYDVVFLDWSMPNLNGYQLLLSCRSDKRLDNMAIIMLTSESEDDNVSKAMESGATAYITKPFKPENIIKKLEYVGLWKDSQNFREVGGVA